MVERTCKCGTKFLAREADIARGWAKSCSKSCAAKRSNKLTGKWQRYQERIRTRAEWDSEDWNFDPMDGHFSNEEN